MCEKPRLFLPLDTLQELRCSECREYLHCGPVKVKLDGDSVCGKCANDPKHSAPLIHHKAFEEVVKLIWFPCKYRDLGCPQYIMFNDDTKHEHTCVFQRYYCPANFLSCTWDGIHSQLPRHYREAHPNLFMVIPTFEIHLAESAQETRIYTQEGLGFVLKLKVSTEDGKFWIKVEHLGQTNTATSTTYRLVLHTTEEDGLKMVTKERSISSASFSSIFDVNDSQCIDINSLLTILENPPTVYCTLDLKIPSEIVKDVISKLEELKCPYCFTYMAPPIFICPEGHSSCEDCTGYNKKCRGCNKENTSFNRNTTLEITAAISQIPCRWTSCKEIFDYSAIRKHEKTCEHKRYKCPRCYKWHGSYNKITDHFAKEHETHRLHLSKKVAIPANKKVYDFYVLVYGDIFGCSLFPTDENDKNFSMWYYGLPTFYDKYDYYVHISKKNNDKLENIETHKLVKCCATENCFSFNVKIPNQYIEKCDDIDVMYFIFEIVEKP